MKTSKSVFFWKTNRYRVTKLYIVTVPLPCIVGDWSNWSAPDASGVRFRVRYMERPPLNGGKECPDLIQLGKGN
jgi:hypothetical protein